jgi:hypothetical protein
MDKNLSIVLSKETTEYRRVAQKHWNLTDEQMNGMHVHHEPPVAIGGRNIPEHLYVCSSSMHSNGWHKGYQFPKLGGEGGKLSAIVRKRKAEERKNLSKIERERLKVQKRERIKARKEKEGKNREYAQRVDAALREHEERSRVKKEKLEELIRLQKEMIVAGLILPDPEGLLL